MTTVANYHTETSGRISKRINNILLEEQYLPNVQPENVRVTIVGEDNE